MTATVCVKSDRLIEQPDGWFAVRSNHGVLSVQPDGSFQERSDTAVGPWERCQRIEGKLVFSDPAYPTGSYALLLVE